MSAPHYHITNPDAKLPTDPNANVPPAVKMAKEAAERLHQQAYQTEPAPKPDDPQVAVISPQPDPQPVIVSPQPNPQPAPVAQVPAQVPAPVVSTLPSSTPEQRAGVAPDTWEGRYYAMEGRHRQSQHTIGTMQEQMSEMGEEIGKLHDMMRQPQRQRPPPPNAQPTIGQAPQVLTDEDRTTYGNDLLSTMKRAAEEALAPHLSTLSKQIQTTSQTVTQQRVSNMWTTVTAEVPNFRQIDVDPRFIAWARLPDVYSGVLRGQLLNDAIRAADAPRVVAIFKGFLNEEQATGHIPSVPVPEPQPAAVLPVPPREPAVRLEMIAAPGRPKPATGQDPVVAAAEKPFITRAQIKAFYRAVNSGQYAGRDQDRAAHEAIIFAAQREGRVQ